MYARCKLYFLKCLLWYHRIYQERATQFQQDLEHSQERELLAVQQLNESVTHAEIALAERDTYAKMVSK